MLVPVLYTLLSRFTGKAGTGKSTLAKAIAGHPDYIVTSGDVLLDGQSILAMEADERARAGIFLAFQYPSEIPGVTIANFLRAALQAANLPSLDPDEGLEFVTTFRNAQIGPGKKSLTLTLHFRDPARTLTSEEVDAQVKTALETLTTRFAAILRA